MSALDLDKLVGTQIEGRYRITGEIGTGGMGKVYRAIPYDDPSTDVAIKLIQKPTGIELDDLLLFQKEAALLSQLHHPNIIYFHEMGVLDHKKDVGSFVKTDGYYIVMEIAPGKNLKKVLSGANLRRNLSFFFEVGIQVASALDYTHSKNIIHRDIKPQNIIVGKAFRESDTILVKVLDFGVARLLEVSGDRKDGEKTLDDVAGTPLYMSPEQTPWMRGTVDQRADLYSLGCVLYEIISGRPPFVGQSREKIMRNHASVLPQSLLVLRPDLPAIVDKIVLKLLAKDPAERYQTAFSLIADLKKVRSLLRHTKTPKSFVLGANDRFNSVSSKLPMVGREAERDQLWENLMAVNQTRGKNRVVLVSGAPGVGRSRFLKDFKHRLIADDIKFVHGRFTRYEDKIPYIGLSTAFNDYLLDVIKTGGSQLEQLSGRLFSFLGSAMSEISDIVPVLEYFRNSKFNTLGKSYGSDDITKVDIDLDSADSLSETFSVLVRCLVDDRKPLVFLLDDFECIDEKSLKLLDKIISSNNSKKLIFVLSLKDDANTYSEELSAFIEKCRHRKQRFGEVRLKPFADSEIEEFVNITLNSHQSLSAELIKFLQSKTAGNPLSLLEYLRAMVANNLLSYDERQKTWRYDVSQMLRTPLVIESVDLILHHIDHIDKKEMEVLEVASVVGMMFRYELLTLTDEADSIVAIKTLQKAMGDNLITQVPEDNKNRHLGKSFSFTHRLIKESIYRRISSERKSQLHFLILKKLQKSEVDHNADSVFTYVHHVNQAISFGAIRDQAHFDDALKYNLMAAQHSEKLRIWQIADRYYEIAYFLLKQRKQEGKYRALLLSVMESLGDTSVLLRRYRLASKLFKTILTENPRYRNRNRILYKLIRTYSIVGELDRAISLINAAIDQNALRSRYSRNWAKVYTLRFLARMVFFGSFDQSFGRYTALELNRNLTRNKFDSESKYFTLILSLGVKIFSSIDSNKALFYLNIQAKHLSRSGRKTLTLGDAINLMADQLYWYGTFYDSLETYKQFDYLIDLAKSLEDKSAMARVLLKRSLGLDYYHGRQEEIHKTMLSIGNFMGLDEHLDIFSDAGSLLLIHSFAKGNFKQIGEISRSCIDGIPSRNPRIPFILAVFFYSLLIRGIRDAIVHKGQKLMRHHSGLSSFAKNPFDCIAKAIILLARGEAGPAKSYYRQFMECFSYGLSKNKFYPFEVDFLLFFAVTYPDIFLFETREKLIDFRYVPVFTEQVLDLCSEKIHERRPIPLLARAKILENTPLHSTAKLVFDNALSLAKLGENHLVRLFIMFYFGRLLRKEAHSRDKDYIEDVIAESGHRKFQILVDMAEREIQPKNQSKSEPDTQMRKAAAIQFGSIFLLNHLQQMVELIKGGNALNADLARCVQRLKEYIDFGDVTVGLLAGEHSVSLFYSTRAQLTAKDVDDYLQPYLNLRNTLFVKPIDIPWQESDGVSGIGVTQLEQASTENSFGDEEDTMPSKQGLGEESTIVMPQPQDTASTEEAKTRNDNLLSALVPLRIETLGIGLLVIEKAAIKLKDSDHLRTELDTFGSQLAILATKKHDFIRPYFAGNHGLRSEQVFEYRKGAVTLEKCAGLNIWSQKAKGAFNRSHGWYLGLGFGHDQYGLFYCNLKGDPVLCRQLAEILWFQVYVIRNLALTTGENTFTTKDIYNELLPIFNNHPDVKRLTTISFSFTLFKLSDRSATSGHFGGTARPVVVGGDEQVTPANRKIFTLTNGKLFRYYEVDARFDHPCSIYLLFEKTEILRSVNALLLEKSLLSDPEMSAAKLHGHMTAKFPAEKVPLCYVAATLAPESPEIRGSGSSGSGSNGPGANGGDGRPAAS